jgi:hypothetical protein
MHTNEDYYGKPVVNWPNSINEEKIQVEVVKFESAGIQITTSMDGYRGSWECPRKKKDEGGGIEGGMFVQMCSRCQSGNPPKHRMTSHALRRGING